MREPRGAASGRPGEAIPSEIELAARYGVSQGTVRKAIDALAADNLVVRRQGKGTFVATHTEEAQSTFRFLRMRARRRSRRVSARAGCSTSGAARPVPRSHALLELKPGDAVVVIRRVLEWRGKPVVLDEITLPAALFRGLTRGAARRVSGIDVQLLRDAVRRAHAERAGAAQGGCSGCRGARACSASAVGAPLLAVERVTCTYGDRPVECAAACATRRRTTTGNAIG